MLKFTRGILTSHHGRR